MFKINRKNFKKAKNNSGFSLAEVLVVLGIISTAMVGIFSLIIQNIQVQKVNKDFLVASMLAQEGLELVRNSRDENWLVAGGTWDGIIGQSNDDFIMDYDDNNIPNDVDGIANARLYKDASGFYSHDNTGTLTQFYRILEIDTGTNPDADGDGTIDFIEVSSHVQWTINGKVYNYIANTLLYDWR